MSDDYKVGYGKPPAKNKFQKGKSGNPSGRPKWKKPPKEPLDPQKALIAQFKLPMTINEAGKKKKVSKLDAFAMAVLAASFQDKGMMKCVLNWMLKLPKEAFVDHEAQAQLEDLFAKFEQDVATWPANLSEATNKEADVD